jgi:DNA-binding transcriptional ArsR family regulator
MEELESALVRTQMPEVTVALQPVYNQLYSLMLLYKGSSMPGVSGWVQQTRERMSLEQLHRNALVMNGLFYAFTTVANLPSFGAYLDHLQALPAESFQDRILAMYMRAQPGGCTLEDRGTPIGGEREAILRSVDEYLAFLGTHFDHAHLDLDLEAQAYHYVIDPPAMKRVIIDHLREMWEQHLATEWTRVRPMLAKSVEAFQHAGLAGKTRREAVKFVIGREPPETHWLGQVETADRVILVPSVHVGPYLGRFIFGSTLVVLFGARMPEGALADVPDLSRTEILTRLVALTDDNRLRILRMAADTGEVRATDVMAALDISQSAASRNLTQLTATGYLVEKRRDGGKSYSLDPARVKDSLAALCRYLGVSAAWPSPSVKN